MPIKQVTCHICKALVNKAQTLLIEKDGKRACRSHPETVRLSGFLQKEKEEVSEKNNLPLFNSVMNARNKQAHVNMKENNEKWKPISRPFSASRLG